MTPAATNTPEPGRPRLLQTLVLVGRAGGWVFVAAVVAMSVTGLGMAVELLIARALVARFTGSTVHGASAGVWILAGAAVLVAGLVTFGTSANAGLHRLLVERVMRWCNERTVEVTARARLIDFDAPEFHDRVRRAQRNATAPVEIAMAAPMLVAAIVTSLGLVVSLGASSPLLIPLALVSGVPVFVAGRTGSDEMYTFTFGQTPQDRERLQLETMLSARDQAAEIRVFGVAEFLLGRWRSLYDERLAELARVVVRFVRRVAVGSAVTAVMLAVLLGGLVWMLASNRVDLVAAATAAVAVLLLANQSQTAATNLARLRENAAYVQDFLQLADLGAAAGPVAPAPAAPASAAPEVAPPAASGFRALAVDRVTFTYPAASAPALRDIAFELRPGEVVAVVGHNGSGKTTLAKLLCGLYEPQRGQVRWNGVPMPLVDTGAAVGAVFQDFARYWFSARDNIAVGDVAAVPDETRVRAAAQEAGVDGFVEALPAGYDTRLAVELDGGVDVSVGQWQRIAIARVLYRGASFVVLDEPTASLDAEAEAELFATIARMRAGRTIVLISHRFSTVRSADRILVLDHGELVEQGSHEALMALGGRYARMYSLQSAAYVG